MPQWLRRPAFDPAQGWGHSDIHWKTKSRQRIQQPNQPNVFVQRMERPASSGIGPTC